MGASPKPVNGTTVVLRSAGESDEPFLYQVYASTRAEEMALVDWTAEQKNAFLRMQFESQRKHYAAVFPQMQTRIIVSDGHAAGRMLIARLSDEFRLVDLAILPAYRNKGIGTALLHDLMNQARAEGVAIRLHVETFNPALKLYERVGFVKLAQKSIYWFMEWQPHVG